jgi:hypothetical protein
LRRSWIRLDDRWKVRMERKGRLGEYEVRVSLGVHDWDCIVHRRFRGIVRASIAQAVID